MLNQPLDSQDVLASPESNSVSTSSNNTLYVDLNNKKIFPHQAFTQSSLTTTLSLNVNKYTSPYTRFLNHVTSVNNSPTLNLISYNLKTLGKSTTDLLTLMSNLQIHIMALQDTGFLYNYVIDKQNFGNYQIIQFSFSKQHNDTLAFIIDEGVFFHYLKDTNNIIKDEKARAILLKLPGALIHNHSEINILNIYAPPNKATWIT